MCSTKMLEKMLFKVVELLEEENVEYWLDFGTLLGLARDGGIIEWDEDVDISVWQTSYDKLEKIKPKLIEFGYIVSNNIDWGNKVYFDGKRKIWVDIYYWKKNNNMYTHASPGFNPKINTFSLSLLGNFTTINFKGKDFVVPEKYEEKLTIMYQDWKTPVRKNLYWG